MLDKKLYQLVIARLDGTRINSSGYREGILRLVKNGIGGFIVFGGIKDEIKDFIFSLQSISEIPLFIASDIERGVGYQIKDTTLFPCQMAISAAINEKEPQNITLLRDMIGAISDEAIDIGINMPLIPVLDINQNHDNPIICTRAFSDNSDVVITLGLEYIRILEDRGLITSGKHFPGHGNTFVDSHIALPNISRSFEDLMKIDILPFKKAVEIGVSSIMVGHLCVKAIDPVPASISKKIITDLLREKLFFNGLVITDALNMNALRDFGDIHIKCINSGVDILLHPEDPDLTVKELKEGIKKRTINIENIETSYNRILKAKGKINNDRKIDVDYKSHSSLSSRITDMSITLLKNKKGILPLSDLEWIKVFIAGNYKPHELSILKNTFKNVFVTENMPSSDIIKPDELLISAIFTYESPGQDTSSVVDEEKRFILSLIRKSGRAIVISFGNPYILRHFKEADILIAAYESTENAQNSVIGCLRGEKGFKGSIPVKIGI